LPGQPELVVYDSDKAIHLCEHHLYNNAKKHLREDGQEGWGNTYRTLLAAAGRSPEGWAAFRNAVLSEPTLTATGAWVRHWDADITEQTARRASMPPHYSTGALDPHIAAVRQQPERRRWTFRNLPRMNALLGLVRLHVNRRDVVANWAKLLTRAVTDEQEAWAATADDRRKEATPSLATQREAALPARRVADLLAAQAPRPAARDRLTADQSIRWAKFTMNPSGPRTDAMRQMPSY
jgi:hypothetical protein